MNSSERSEVDVDSQSQLLDNFALRALAYARQNATGKTNAAFGPATLRFEICGTVLSSIALDPLRHAATSPTAPVDFLVVMIDGKDTSIDGPALNDFALFNNGRKHHGDIGSRRSTLTVNQEWNTRCLIDADKRHAIVWFADATTIPEWVIYDHIRNALHWVSYEGEFGLFHAAALQLGAVGCLITGKSGSGKSTITAAAIARGFDSAGDDFVLIETTTVPRVHAVFDTVKLDDKSLARFPQFEPFIRNRRPGTRDKAIVHLFDSSRGRIASGFPLHAILHAHLTGQPQSRIVKSAPSDAFRALAPSSLMLLRAQGKQVAANCAVLVTRLGTYAFEIGTDINAAVAELAGFMRQLKQ
jgi:hypothetical protein